MLLKNNLTFEDLRAQYGTGRAYTISGSGRNRVTGYRTGIKCNAGDIEVSEWVQLMKDLIERKGESELYHQLYTFMKERNYVQATKSELEIEVLILHARRIFDDEAWIYFVDFNQLYRPFVLDSHRLKWVRTQCCKKSGLVTQTIIERSRGTGMIPCPFCGRFSEFNIEHVMVERKLVG